MLVTIKIASKMYSGFRLQITPLSTITFNYNWVAGLTRCHELSGYLVLDTPLLSLWWTATSI